MARQLRCNNMGTKSQKLEETASNIIVVPLTSKAEQKEDCSSGVFAMRHMEKYMGAPSEAWENHITKGTA